MRHQHHQRKFGRERNQRLALMRSLTEALIKHARISTTGAKAKELRPWVEKLITQGRSGTLASRRVLISKLGTAARAKQLMAVALKYQGRHGGYTRIVKLPPRKSDGSKMALLELV